VLYFAYGSNLSKLAMRRRAPTSRPIIAAMLPDHRLTFESNEPANARPAYFANVRHTRGSFVPGALYYIERSDLIELDRYEEVHRGIYDRVELVVNQADGKRSRAHVYRMPVEGRPMYKGRPSLEQLTQVRLGYADWGLDLRVLDKALHR
jgi:gamma-glutamylcyclotransferase (GGCT)/AIG2-like uncharacterized protein YtfP